jgi:hypothetical protein
MSYTYEQCVAACNAEMEMYNKDKNVEEFNYDKCLAEYVNQYACTVSVEQLDEYLDESIYIKYIKPKIINGWKNNVGDCWLDSVLYMLFSSNESEFFSYILDYMRTCLSDSHAHNMASYLSCYLVNINNNKWNPQLKAHYKQKIVHSLKKMHTRLCYDDEQINSFFEIIDDKNRIGRGQYYPILEMFISYDPKKIIMIKQIDRIDNINNDNCIENIIKHCTRTVGDQIEIFIINSNLSINCHDDTKITSILNICNDNRKFILNGIICGIGDHIIAYSYYNMTWWQYNNNEIPCTYSICIDDEISQNIVSSSQLTLMYKITIL